MQHEYDVAPRDVENVYPAVAEIITDALARDRDEIRLDSYLIEDLGAESIDFLDIVFRLEQRFEVQIPRGKLIDDARGELSDEEFEQEGRLTSAGLARLRAYMTEVPADRFRPGLLLAEIPLLFNVETFCRIVVRARRAAAED
jgi:acyl carrier protein